MHGHGRGVVGLILVQSSTWPLQAGDVKVVRQNDVLELRLPDCEAGLNIHINPQDKALDVRVRRGGLRDCNC